MVIKKTDDGEKHKDKEIQIKHELAERSGSICIYIYIYTWGEKGRKDKQATKVAFADTRTPPGGDPVTLRRHAIIFADGQCFMFWGNRLTPA